VSQWPRVLRLFGVLALLVGLYFAVPVSTHPEDGLVVRVVISVLVFAGLIVAVVSQLRSHLVDQDRRVDGLVASIVLIVVVFALAFYVLELRNPGEVAGLQTRVDALYFTMTTMTTVGYGDIYAAGQVARGLVLVQMAFNLVLVAAAAALLSERLRSAARARARSRADVPPPDASPATGEAGSLDTRDPQEGGWREGE
jgi:voltage-gated potassium channel